MLARGRLPESEPLDVRSVVGWGWRDELAEVVYVDAYGNLVTGHRASALGRGARLSVAGRDIAFARTFCEVPAGHAFWYENSFGLVELAVNGGNACLTLGLGPGDPIGLPSGRPHGKARTD